MAERRILALPAELVQKINDNRGDISQAEFIELLIDEQLKEEKPKETVKYVTKEELRSFEQDMKLLLKNFLDFFVTYGLEMGDKTQQIELVELTSKLHGLQNDLSADNPKGTGTIKWK